MLTISGRSRRFCDGIGRREFLKIGAFGGAFNLTDLLRGESPAASKPRKAAIHIVLGGGPPHLDMWDMKPDAPAEIRGEFKPIPTNVPGVQICELMPKLARMWDKLAVIRSISSTSGHDDAEISTGYNETKARAVGYPSFGAVVSKLNGPGRNGVPPFVSLRPKLWAGNPAFDFGNEPGYLGSAHRAFTPDGPGTAITNEFPKSVQNRVALRPPEGVSLDRIADRRTMLTAFDNMRRDADTSGMDAITSRAFEIITSDVLRNALDLDKESQAVRDRYGRNFYYDFPGRQWEVNYGAQALAARRLVEAGAGCVTIGFNNWDTHENNFRHLRRQLPPLDSAVSSLVGDLHDRGMAKDVVVVVWGEFGRSPVINKTAGRDHWGPVMSALVAGGGLKMGQAIGTTDAKGERATSRRYKVPNVLSTLYHAMGIDTAQTLPSPTGRPMYLLDERDKVAELL
ncbi:DUF1501 domain-containing protein [Zavarzinella formosa]|uniref:DUF1501 domain-containing protein n=1 Tax=Zavarzinella formosa TaxID=360055 RepID=UPI0002F0D07A|nr:DUF1501 domain-containing protein [Zavarzinella formosa]